MQPSSFWPFLVPNDFVFSLIQECDVRLLLGTTLHFYHMHMTLMLAVPHHYHVCCVKHGGSFPKLFFKGFVQYTWDFIFKEMTIFYAPNVLLHPIQSSFRHGKREGKLSCSSLPLSLEREHVWATLDNILFEACAASSCNIQSCS